MRCYKSLIAFFIIAYSCIVFAEKAQKDFATRTAIVDVQAVLESSIAMQKMRKEMEQISAKIQQDLSAKEQELKTIEQELVRSKPNMNEDEFQKKVDAFNAEVSKAQKDMQDRKVKLEKAYADAMNQIHEATIDIIQTLAFEENFNLAIPSSQVLFVRDYMNITPEVINRLNHQVKSLVIKYEH